MSISNIDAMSLISEQKPKSVDLILTDPPYAISRDSGYTQNSPDKKKYIKKYGNHTIDFGEWDHKFDIEDLKAVVDGFYNILRNGGTAIIFYDIWKIQDLSSIMKEVGFKQLRVIEWVKSNPVPINSKLNYLSNCREIAILGVKKGKPTFNSKYDKGIYTYPICQDAGRFHPTQKPLALFTDLILKHSNEGDIVFDPFAGSGTTEVVCMTENRTPICGEIDPEYYNKALDRTLR